MRRLAREHAGAHSARIVNLAARALVGGPAANPVAGFVLQGTAAKRMLVRAVGPGLAAFGVPGTLPDPSLTLNIGGVSVIENDSWNAVDAPVFAAAGAFALPAGSRDAAVVSALAPGGYTTPVGAGGGTGIVLLEVYDAETGSNGSRLINASTRAFVGQNAGILIPGFVIQGDGVIRLLLRATGPGLAPFGVPEPLADPQLTLFSDRLAIVANDNWGASPDVAEITQVARRLGAFDLPPQSLDAALLVTLRAGTYTAHASGVAGATGTALVEIYLLP